MWGGGYPYGYLEVAFYYTSIPESVTCRVYSDWAQNPGWHSITLTNVCKNSNQALYRGVNTGFYGVTQMEITINAKDTVTANVTEVAFYQTRGTLQQMAVFNKTVAQTLYHDLTGTKFIVSGGTSSQFLKADGSLDSNTYITSASIPTNVSAFNNDAGYITSSALTPYELKSSLKEGAYVNVDEITMTSSSTNLPTAKAVASYISGLNYITSADIPTNVSAFTNDAGYLTSHQSLAGVVASAQYNATAKKIEFYNPSGTKLNTDIDASAFIKDGMVDTVEISNGKLVISFNTDAGKEDIEIPISDIFNASNYYTKSETNTQISSAISDLNLGTASTKNYSTDMNTDANLPTTAAIKSYITNKNFATVSQIPTTTSQLTNNSGFITSADIPTNVSVFTNDSGYITSAALTPYELKTNLKEGAYVNVDEITMTSSSTNLPTSKAVASYISNQGFATVSQIPDSTSDLTNDSGFITSADIPANVSSFTNDAGYLVSSDLPTNHVTTDTAQEITGTKTIAESKLKIGNTSSSEDIDNFVFKRGQEFIVGTQTSSTSLWKGNTIQDSIYEGMCVNYFVPVACTSTAITLELTLPDGTTTGAIPVRRNAGSTATSTHISVGSVVQLTLLLNRTVGSTSYEKVWRMNEWYDSNTNTTGYQLRTNSTVMNVSDTARYYKLYFTSANGNLWVPASVNSTNDATTARAVNQRPINPFGRIVYTSASTNYATGANLAATTIWDQYNLSLGYSFNVNGGTLTLTAEKPVYVKCAPQADGSAIIDSTTPTVQDLPTSNDGKIYIFLGTATSATAVELFQNHPVYYHDGNGIKLWSGVVLPSKTSDLTNDSGFITSANIPTNVSAFTNDAGYLTSYTETDPTVPNWAKQTSKPSYTLDEVNDGSTRKLSNYELKSNLKEGAYINVDETTMTSSSTNLPTGKAVASYISGLGYITTESDPTVPSWAKQSSKPSYTLDEVSDGSTRKLSNYVQTSRKVNNKALSSDVTLTLDDIADGTTRTIPTVNNSTITIKKNSSDTGDSFTTNAASGKTINLGLATVATSGSYNDLSNKPTIPTVNNATLTIQKNGTTVKTFTANASSNVTANITVPIESISVDGTTQTITDKNVDLHIPDDISAIETIGSFYRNNVNGSGNITLTSTLCQGQFPTISVAGTYKVRVRMYSSTASYSLSVRHGSNNTYTLTSSNGVIDDTRSLTLASGDTWSGTLTTAVGANTVIRVHIYRENIIVNTVGITAVSNDYNDLDNIPTIPTATSQLTNNSGFITSSSLSSYVPTTRTINSKALSSNITLTLDDVADGSTRKLSNYVTTDTAQTITGLKTINKALLISGTNSDNDRGIIRPENNLGVTLGAGSYRFNKCYVDAIYLSPDSGTTTDNLNVIVGTSSSLFITTSIPATTYGTYRTVLSSDGIKFDLASTTTGATYSSLAKFNNTAITAYKNIIPSSSSVQLGTSSDHFNTAYIDNLYVNNGTALSTYIAGITVTNATNATYATNTTNVAISVYSEDTNYPIVITDTGSATYKNLAKGTATYNPSTNTLTCSTFNGSLTGNADTATTAILAYESLMLSTINAYLSTPVRKEVVGVQATSSVIYNLIPAIKLSENNVTTNLGSSSYKWNSLYCNYIGDGSNKITTVYATNVGNSSNHVSTSYINNLYVGSSGTSLSSYIRNEIATAISTTSSIGAIRLFCIEFSPDQTVANYIAAGTTFTSSGVKDSGNLTHTPKFATFASSTLVINSQVNASMMRCFDHTETIYGTWKLLNRVYVFNKGNHANCIPFLAVRIA